jgi:hypothetical protein
MTSRRDADQREHDAYRLLVAATVDGSIDPDDAPALEAHLAGCPACRADQRAMLEDHRWLATPRSVTFPDPSMRESVIRAARSPAIPQFGPRERPWAGLAAAALTVAIMGAGLLWWNQQRFGLGTQPDQTPGQSAGACAPMPSGLTAWWPGEGDGGELVAGREATLRPGATTGPGLVGQAFELDGQTGFAEVALDPALRIGAADMTIMLWVRFDDITGDQVLMEQWRDPSPGVFAAGWTFTKRADHSILFTSGAEGVGEGAETPPLTLERGVWYHLAVRRAQSDMKIHVNGQPTGAGGIAGPQIDIGVDLPLMIGRRGDDRGFHLDGALDEIQMVIGRALSESEIGAWYRAGSSGTCPR